jgi:hypothetical protein
MLGSMALQQCLRAGVIQYRFVVFEFNPEKTDGI